jgi:hypothetical protein
VPVLWGIEDAVPKFERRGGALHTATTPYSPARGSGFVGVAVPGEIDPHVLADFAEIGVDKRAAGGGVADEDGNAVIEPTG